MRFVRLRSAATAAAMAFACLVAFPQTASASAPLATAILGQPDYVSHSNSSVNTATTYAFQTAMDGVHGRLFVADAGNHRVSVYNVDTAGHPVHNYPDIVLGQPNVNANTDNNGGRNANTMWEPKGVAYDQSTNKLFVSDTNNSRILVFDGTNLSTGMSASNVIGQPDFTASTGAVTATGVIHPFEIALDEVHHRLFVPDIDAHRVTVYDTSSITNGMSASYYLGQSNSTNNGAATTATGMDTPLGVAYDPGTQYLYVSEEGNARILVFDTASIATGMAASYVIGQADFTSSGTSTTQSTFNIPDQLGIDSDGHRLYVADIENNRVVTFDLTDLHNGMNAIGIYGQTDFNSNGSGLTQSGFSEPESVSYDSFHRQIIVSDTNIDRILFFDANSLSHGANISFTVQPTLTFTVGSHAGSCNTVAQTAGTSATGTSVALGHGAGSAVAVAAQDLTISTNAANGFSIFAKATGPFSDGNGHNIADVSGTNAVPGSFPSVGTEGFGYTTDDSTLSASVTDRFTNPSAKWAKLTTSNAEVSYGATGPVSNNVACVAYKVGISSGTLAGAYSTTVIYTAVPSF